MTYTAYDGTKPDGATQTGPQVLASIKANQAALRDMTFFACEAGWSVAHSGGTADQPGVVTFSKGVERIRLTLTWGTSGGANGNVTQAVIAYSSNSGTAYDNIETRTIGYDASGNWSSGMPMLLLTTMMAYPGKLKSLGTRVTTLESAASPINDAAASGTTAWSSNKSETLYAKLAGANMAGNLGIKTATHTVVTPGALAVDWTAGHRQLKSLSANSTFTFTAPAGASNLSLMVRNTGASAVTLTWPASVKWPNDVPPGTHAAGKTGLYFFYFDGTTYWGSYIQGYTNV